MSLLGRLLRRNPALSLATPTDASALAVLHAEAFHHGWSEEEFERMLLDRSVVAHRAMVGGSLAGFIISRLAADESEILSVAVAPAHRARGIAGLLLELHLRQLAGRGARTAFLEVSETNLAARRLYQRASFHQVGRRENYYRDRAGPPRSALILRRDL